MTIAALVPRAPATAPAGPAWFGGTIVHETPGRIRLHVPRVRTDPAYAARVAYALAAHPGVQAARVSAASGSVMIRFDPQLTDRQVIESLLAVLPISRTGPAIVVPSAEARTLIAGAAALALAAVGGPTPLTAIALTLAAAPIFGRAVSGLLDERTVSVDALDATAVGVLAARGDLVTSAFSTSLIAGGEYIRALTARRSRAALTDLVTHDDEPVWRVHGKRIEAARLSDLVPGDVISCYAGSLMPVDGRVVGGEALFDEKALTGESMPVPKRAGAAVYAATLITEGSVHVRVERIGRSTRAGRVVQLLESAPTYDTRASNYARRIGDRLALPTLLLGGAVWGVTGDVARAAAVVIFDFATGLRVSAPTTVLASMTKAARSDVLIKSGRALEKLAAIDTLVFDKTGTLTTGIPFVERVRTVSSDRTAADIVRLAAGAEQRLAHPAAQAIVAAAGSRGIPIPSREDTRFLIGKGVRATIEGTPVLVGSATWLRAERIDIPTDLVAAAVEDARRATSTVFVAADGVCIGSIAYADPPRAEAPAVISELRARGIEAVMLTGDSREVAAAVAATLGIGRVVAEAFPDRKADVVRALQHEGHGVGVVGDGINDSVALAYADVSLAVVDGTDLAREIADVVLHDGLGGVIVAVDVARDAAGLLRQNLVLSLVPNAVGIALATGGMMGPAVATAINNGSALAAGLNGMRPLLAPTR